MYNIIDFYPCSVVSVWKLCFIVRSDHWFDIHFKTLVIQNHSFQWFLRSFLINYHHLTFGEISKNHVIRRRFVYDLLKNKKKNLKINKFIQCLKNWSVNKFEAQIHDCVVYPYLSKTLQSAIKEKESIEMNWILCTRHD